MMEFIFRWEGDPGYVNHPADPGGETKYGICKMVYPDLDIQNLTKEKALELYYKDYFVKNKINNLPAFIQMAFFDCCVNQGNGYGRTDRGASPWLQQAVNRQSEAKGFKDIAVDGKVGPITRRHAILCNPYVLMLDFVDLRLDHYRRIAKSKGRHVFLEGWENRMNDLIGWSFT